MKFTISTVIAFAAAALAKPILTNSDYTIEEGKPFTITWSNAEGPVTITLKNGPSKNLKDVAVITSGQSGNQFTWTPKGLPSDTYALEITDSSGEPNYSVPFVYEGTGPAPSASSSTHASSKAASSSAPATSAASSTTESSSTITSAASSTTSSSSTVSTSTRTSTTRTAPVTTPTNQNSEGQRFSSPLALLLVTVAAVFFFN